VRWRLIAALERKIDFPSIVCQLTFIIEKSDGRLSGCNAKAPLTMTNDK
jgi:hypothetical protein